MGERGIRCPSLQLRAFDTRERLGMTSHVLSECALGCSLVRLRVEIGDVPRVGAGWRPGALETMRGWYTRRSRRSLQASAPRRSRTRRLGALQTFDSVTLAASRGRTHPIAHQSAPASHGIRPNPPDTRAQLQRLDTHSQRNTCASVGRYLAPGPQVGSTATRHCWPAVQGPLGTSVLAIVPRAHPPSSPGDDPSDAPASSVPVAESVGTQGGNLPVCDPQPIAHTNAAAIPPPERLIFE
jgi:hypothetical protein